MSTMERVIFNFAPLSNIRYEELAGTRYLVAPMAMLAEGVHAGSLGPMLYLNEELKKVPEVWNMKPITYSHPELGGQKVSACTPLIYNTHGLGYVMNARFDTKLRAEAWLNVDLCNRIDDAVIKSIETGKKIEISTGLYSVNEEKEGEWNGKSYVGVVRDIRPDHLAVLMNTKGAYSIADGGGLLQLNELVESGFNAKGIVQEVIQEVFKRHGCIFNDMSHGRVYSALWAALQDRYNGDNTYISDVYDDFIIFERDGELYKLSYTTDDKKIKLDTSNPEKVQRVTEYRSVDGTFIGNVTDSNSKRPNNRETDMDKAKFVDDLISNKSNSWTAEDREALLALNEAQLNKLSVAPVTPVTNSDDTTTTPPPDEVPVTNIAKPPATVSLNDYINSAPPELRDVLREGIVANANERQRVVSTILANANNVFTEDQLKGKPLDELRSIAALCGDNTQRQPQSIHDQVQNYAGQAGIAPRQVANEAKVTPLVAPSTFIASGK